MYFHVFESDFIGNNINSTTHPMKKLNQPIDRELKIMNICSITLFLSDLIPSISTNTVTCWITIFTQIFKIYISPCNFWKSECDGLNISLLGPIFHAESKNRSEKLKFLIDQKLHSFKIFFVFFIKKSWVGRVPVLTLGQKKKKWNFSIIFIGPYMSLEMFMDHKIWLANESSFIWKIETCVFN
jgi:hypothetical protein